MFRRGFREDFKPDSAAVWEKKISINSTLEIKPGQYGEQGIVSSNRSLNLELDGAGMDSAPTSRKARSLKLQKKLKQIRRLSDLWESDFLGGRKKESGFLGGQKKESPL